MVALTKELALIVRCLDDCQIPYALCGGLAVALHGYVRATKDIDLLVQAKDVALILQAIEAIGFNLEGGTIPVGFGETHPCEIRRVSKATGKRLTTLDLIVVNPPLELAWNSRERVDWNGQPLWTVSRDGLGIMKRLSHRPSDLVDLRNLGISTDDD